MQFSDVQWASGLSHVHTRDAIEHWNSELLVDLPGEVQSRYPDASWRFRFTSKGRSWVENGPPATAVGGTYVAGDVHMHAQGSGNIQQIGSGNFAGIQQAMASSITQAIEAVKDHLNEYPPDVREEVQEHLATLEQERTSPNARPSRVEAAFNAILRITKQVGDAVSPFRQYGADDVTALMIARDQIDVLCCLLLS